MVIADPLRVNWRSCWLPIEQQHMSFCIIYSFFSSFFRDDGIFVFLQHTSFLALHFASSEAILDCRQISSSPLSVFDESEVSVEDVVRR